MRISVDISYYPLNEGYVIPILDFIARLNQYKQLVVETNGMSTQVFGEYDDVIKAVTTEIKKSFELPHSVFILKMVNAHLQKS